MKNKVISSLFVLMFILTNLVKSWAETGDKPTLMIGSVIASEAVKSLAATDNKTRDLDQLIQSLDSEFQNQINATRKFQIVGAKSVMQQLSQVQEFQNSGNVDPSTAARFGELAGASLIAIPSITEFIYAKDSRNFGGLGKSVDVTVLRVRCILNVYDTTKGTLKGSARFVREERDNDLGSGLGSSLEKQVIGNIAEALSGEMSNRLVDFEFPPRVVLALGPNVAFNRGDQSGIKLGEIYEVYATQVEEIEGEKFEVEFPVGIIRIIRSDPKLTYGQVQGENLGIAKGCTVRKKQEIPENPAVSLPNSNQNNAPSSTQPEQQSLRDRLRNQLK